ncbi:FmdB family transcriptional regulator [Ectothiorhodospira shaposhnikovii]|uniref:FmdB family zinc ribbon protein n=1 Tax=Ectothiorhodospira shaposhnikovii TaxID=1054 RepID=UPI001902E547|nr:zinc ribbon domain-containing protein [Ectothiorhodospira shaposhnikovii]MBK1674606.1 FmdB family transcriptional regulator [Ectothiorhodospira shaposhnikovii]
MPIYEYECNACGHRLEAIQKFSDAPLVDCPECHGATLQKQVSAPAFRLGGSGWYETDFKNGNKKNLKDDGKAPACGADSKSGGGADACAACKAAS